MQLILLAPLASALLRGGQPIRCATSVCKAFESDCSTAGECVTDQCYEGKCGLGATCKPYGELCFTDSPHTCCTGNCLGVVVRQDCIKLLGGEGSTAGVNIDRQCDRVGICEHWPGVDTGPSVLTTPWAVDPEDDVQKYYSLAGLTFKEGTAIDTALVKERRMGRVRHNVNPAADKPRSVMDAGVLEFVPGSRVAREIVGYHEFGDEKFCIAPVLNAGVGGGYYAVGIDCCTKDEFKCGVDSLQANVVSSNLPDFAQARLILEADKGVMYHGAGKGIESDAPLYVTFSADAVKVQEEHAGHVAEIAADLSGEKAAAVPGDYLEVVLPTNVTYCVAPIGVGPPQVGFFAVGENCCNEETKEFTCGDVAKPEARSGSLVNDITGDYITAVKMAEFTYGFKPAPRPIFLSWTAEVLVTKP